MGGIFYYVNTGGRPYDDRVEREVKVALDNPTNRRLLTCPIAEIPKDRIIDLEAVKAATRKVQRAR